MNTVTKKVIISNSQLQSEATPQGQRSKSGRLNSKAYYNEDKEFSIRHHNSEKVGCMLL